jgi:hypothetical protein
MGKTIGAAGVIALMTTGCTFTYAEKYDPKAFASWRIAQDQKVEGRVLILTTAEDDAFIYSGAPKGTWVGSATTLTLPLGVITREAAARVLGGLFVGGAVTSNDGSQLAGYGIVVTPRLADFGYEIGLFSRSHLEASVRVTVRDAEGKAAFEKIYASGRFEVTDPSDFKQRVIAHAAHVVIQTLMLRAAADVKAHLEGRPLPSDGAARPPSP